MHMFDESDGWGITETQVLRTNDGGETWLALTPPGLKTKGSIVTESFLDLEHVWLLSSDMNDFPRSGTLYRTLNGGISWEALETPFSGGSMTFLDEEHGWIMADLGAGAGSNAVAIFQTVDGGNTWNQQFTNDPTREGAAESLPLGGLKYDLVPLDMKSAFIGGVIYAPGRVYLYRTVDKGKSWQVATPDLPSAALDSEISVQRLQFFDEQYGFLVLRFGSDEIKLAVYSSKDGGKSWDLTPDIINSRGVAEFSSSTDGVIYANGSFYLTNDAGQTWSVVQPDIQFGESLASMDFLNSKTGWVITYSESGDRSLFRTTDGCKSFEEIQ